MLWEVLFALHLLDSRDVMTAFMLEHNLSAVSCTPNALTSVFRDVSSTLDFFKSEEESLSLSHTHTHTKRSIFPLSFLLSSFILFFSSSFFPIISSLRR